MRTKKSYIIENYLIPKNSKITILNEKVSFADLKNLLSVSRGNDNLEYFYKQRNRLNGQGNRNIKYVTCEFNPETGAMSILFTTSATFNDTDKKELQNQNINDGTLINNSSKEYALEFRICDFTDILLELVTEDDDNFTKEDMKAIIELSEEIRLGCNCGSQYWMGGDFYLTQMDAQIKDCTIAPQFWNLPHLRPNVPLCKHLTSLIQHLNFFLPQISQGVKSELKRYGLL